MAQINPGLSLWLDEKRGSRHRGWVVDFGKGGFGQLREWLHATFDHTLLVAEDDPAREEFLHLRDRGLADVRVVPGTSCEAIAKFVFENTQPMIAAATQGRCWISTVECFEHGANSALFENPDATTRQVSAEVLSRAIAQLG